ncbi:hypothetical protein Glove_593g19 [Diversispora epigaea]|uniref:Uncharacterized protein n=1 Tax=Diversispora epigaea TaxID=1348612 RepID=A0A397GDQ2_9GLOM|nr:hypothetical protein Glove_593g19 [Diversispora epigaea]
MEARIQNPIFISIYTEFPTSGFPNSMKFFQYLSVSNQTQIPITSIQYLIKLFELSINQLNQFIDLFLRINNLVNRRIWKSGARSTRIYIGISDDKHLGKLGNFGERLKQQRTVDDDFGVVDDDFGVDADADADVDIDYDYDVDVVYCHNDNLSNNCDQHQEDYVNSNSV